jgi:hypothetical protein
MDNTKKSPLSLEQVLNSYNIMILFFVTFFVLIGLLFVTNKKGFNTTFGYEIFITIPILLVLALLINEIFKFKKTNTSLLYSILPESIQSKFIVVVSLFILLLGIIGFFMVLYIGGIFSDNPPENNTAMLLNFFIIVVFILIAGLIYTKYKNNDDSFLKTLPLNLQNMFELRTKYTALFALLVIVITALYFFNPWGLMTNYGGPVLFFSLFVGMILMMLIMVYQYYLANPSKGDLLKGEPGFFGYFLKGIYILGALGISAGLIFGALKFMGVFDQNASQPNSWTHIIFNLILFCGMLAIIYKLANAGGFLDKNPYYRLILNTILYIPCLLVSIIDNIRKILGLMNGTKSSFTPPTPFEYKMLLLGLVLSGGYFIWMFLGKPFVRSKYLKQGGKQLINQPIQTDKLTNVASYQTLSGSDKFNYKYALSCWFYLDSFPPSTNSSYLKVVPLLSYGENPTIKYSSVNNTLYITVKQQTEGSNIIDYIQENDTDLNTDNIEQWNTITDSIEKVKEMPFGNDVDADGHRIIYKHSDVLLQKWNHIVLNYNGGTLDVFYNGKLVKSAIEVVPYMNFDMLTVGTENGISGNIANLIYFNEPLSVLTVNRLYTSLKDKNPPSIPDNNQKLIPLM